MQVVELGNVVIQLVLGLHGVLAGLCPLLDGELLVWLQGLV